MFGIKTNISALNAASKLNASVVEQSTTMKRLATGLRVNSARDDAASLAISTGLEAQTRGLKQAIRNIQDGISLAQTAESAIGSSINNLQRMRELALQSSNGTLTLANRSALQLEFDANINQINHVLITTNFNGIKLFNGSASDLKIQSGINPSDTSTIRLPKMTSFSLLGLAGSEFLNVKEESVPPTISTVTENQSYTASNTNNYNDAIFIDNKLVVSGVGIIDGASVSILNPDLAHDSLLLINPPAGISALYDNNTGILKLSGVASVSSYQEALRNVQFKTDSNATIGTRNFDLTLGTALKGPNGNYYQYIDSSIPWTAAKEIAHNSSYMGMKGYLVTITDQLENSFVSSIIPKAVWIGASDAYDQINAAVGSTVFSNQTSAEGNWYWVDGPEKGSFISAGNFNPQGNMYNNWNTTHPQPDNYIGGGYVGDPNQQYGSIFSPQQTFGGYWQGGTWFDTDNQALAGIPTGLLIEYSGEKTINISANTSIEVGTNWHPAILKSNLAQIDIVSDIKTVEGASSAIPKLDSAIGKLINLRSYLGAIQNTLSAAGDNLTSTGVNTTIANGRLIDADYSQSSTDLSRNQIINQASSAILAQANQEPQLVLQLLKN